MGAFERLAAWQQTKASLATFGLFQLAGAYIFITWAIDTGSLLDYFLGFMLFIFAVVNLTRLTRKVVHNGR